MFLPNPSRLVYWANVEFSYEPGSEYHGDFDGGFVYGFVQAVDARDAMNQFELEFSRRKLGIRFVEFINLYAEVEWETPEDQNHFDRIAVRSSVSEEVKFDSFEIYQRR